MSFFFNMESSVFATLRFVHWGVKGGEIVNKSEMTRLFSWSSVVKVLNFGLKSSEGRELDYIILYYIFTRFFLSTYTIIL